MRKCLKPEVLRKNERKRYKHLRYNGSMGNGDVAHMHEDIEVLKQDIAVIKHILSEEGSFTPEAKKLLEEARKTSKKEYISHEALKKKLLK